MFFEIIIVWFYSQFFAYSELVGCTLTKCKLKKIKSSEIVTGDVLWIPNDSELAADILLVGGGNVTK